MTAIKVLFIDWFIVYVLVIKKIKSSALASETHERNRY